MEKFGLELESSKSRLIEFGRFAEQNRRARGECKPETFDFLGFTFYCSKTRKGGFVPKVQTSRKKFEQKVRAYKNWIYDNRNRPMREIIKELNVKLIGHYRYYGVTWNFRKITTFLHRVQQFLFKAMNRRGCRRAYTWNGFVEMLKYYPLAKPKTYYCLYWSECYYEEPYAGKPHVRICEGLRLRGLSLLDCLCIDDYLELRRCLMKTVLLHGLGQTAQDWKEVVQYSLSSDNFVWQKGYCQSKGF